MKNLITLIFTLICSSSFAAKWTDPNTGISWFYEVRDGKACLGDGSLAIDQSTTGSISIPSTLGGKSVTSIGKSAFDGCANLTSVSIPPCVISVGTDAFRGCSKMSRVDIADLAKWCQIEFGNLTANPLYFGLLV